MHDSSNSKNLKQAACAWPRRSGQEAKHCPAKPTQPQNQPKTGPTHKLKVTKQIGQDLGASQFMSICWACWRETRDRIMFRVRRSVASSYHPIGPIAPRVCAWRILADFHCSLNVRLAALALYLTGQHKTQRQVETMEIQDDNKIH